MQKRGQMNVSLKKGRPKLFLPAIKLTLMAFLFIFIVSPDSIKEEIHQFTINEEVSFVKALKTSKLTSYSLQNEVAFDNDSGSGSGGGGGGSTSCNISNAGVIGGTEVRCGGYTPGTITSVRGANSCTTSGGQIGGSNSGGGSGSGSGGGGGVVGGTCAPVYQWQRKTPNGNWQNIAGATGSIYNPSFQNQTFWYRRAARSSCGTIWRYSNTIDKHVIINYNNGGTISGNESNCSSFNAFTITNASGPSGGNSTTTQSTTRYQWQRRTLGGGWQNIGGATSISYAPGFINQTTEYRRGAARTPCNDYAFSNIVTKTIGGPGCVENCTNGIDDDGDGLIDCADPDCNGNVNCAPPSITVTDITVNENGGIATVQICASAASNSVIMVNYSTANGSAISGNDFTTIAAKATIPVGQTCTNVSINIIDDNINEPNENFVINLTNPMGATIGDPQGQITIIDNDIAPAITLTVNDITVNESAGTAMLTICASGISTTPITVNYTTLNGSAQAGLDFNNVTGTITIPAGQLCMNITIPIVDDNVQEPTETLFLSLTNPNGATIADPLGQVTILDNDDSTTTPAITINDITVNENDGTATLQICIPAPSNSNVSVNYNTANGSAQMNVDYSFASGLATIPAGQTCTNVTVPIIDDNNPEPTENFVVNLTNPNGGTIADPQGQVTILDNDDAPNPQITINDITVTEGVNPTATLQICIPAPSNSNVSVNYNTANGSAQMNVDYSFASGLATIPAGQTCTNVTVPIINDNSPEPTENFVVNLNNPNGGTISDPQGQVTILDNDDAPNPSITINDVTVNEDAGTATTQLTLSSPSNSPVTVNYSSSNGSAIVNSDYGFVSGTVTFPAGSTTATITSPILDDQNPEPTENFAINLANPNNATIADPQGTVTILDNDDNGGGPDDCKGLSISGTNGQVVISGITSSSTKIEIIGQGTGWALQVVCDGNCGNSQTIPNLSAGEYTIKVQTFDPYCYAEYKVNVTPGGGGTPSISINDITVNENVGTATLQLNLSNPSTNPVTVNYSSSNGSAIVNSDYGFVSGTVTFPVGSTSAILSVPILDDANPEQTETFNIDLANANNATIADPQGTVTILDNDNGGGGGNDCEGLTVSGSNGQVTIAGIKSTNTKIEIQGAGTGWALQLVCDGNCGTSQTVSGLSAGEYTVKVQTFDPYCYAEYKVNTNGGGGNLCPDGSPKQTPGTACNDYNPNTHYDAIQADGCTCTGTPTGGGTPNCDNVSASFINSKLTVSGLNAPITILKIFNSSWRTVFECSGDKCPETVIFNADPSETICHLDVQFYTADWQLICGKQITVNLNGSATGRNAPQLEFSAFSAKREVALEWVTNTGWRNNYFEVERSIDGENFKVLNKVSNEDLTDEMAYYAGKDIHPVMGTNYYRIKQTYQDGTFDYTDIQRVNFEVDLDGFSMYPNPAKEELNLSLKPFTGLSGKVNIINTFGQVVQSLEINNLQSDQVNMSLNNMANGFYQVMIQIDGRPVITRKLIVEKLY